MAPGGASASAPGPYAVGETVAVAAGEHFYQARVLEAAAAGRGKWRYRLHYTGWDPSYDEWVDAEGARESAGGRERQRRQLAGATLRSASPAFHRRRPTTHLARRPRR